MASDRARIRRSVILNHPLGGGGAGLLRESGLIDSKSHMARIWGKGLVGDDRRIVDRRAIPGQMTNLRYDETMQGTVIGFGGTGNAKGRTEM